MESIAPPFRIAFCIECHKYTPVLQTLVDLLDHPGNELFIHVDAKSCLADFRPLRGKVHFIRPRIKVYWGHVSQIACMLQLFKATQQSGCHNIGLLSGDTLPLHSHDEIRRHLKEQYTRKAELIPSESNESKITERMRKMHYVKYREKHSFLWRMNRSFTRRFCPGENPLFDKLPPMEKVATGSLFPIGSGTSSSTTSTSSPIFGRPSATLWQRTKYSFKPSFATRPSQHKTPAKRSCT